MLMTLTGLSRHLGYSSAAMRSMALKGVLTPSPHNSSLYDTEEARAAVKAHENGEWPPAPAVKAARKPAAKKPGTKKRAAPEPRPIEPPAPPPMPPPAPPSDDDDEVGDITPKDMQREKFLKVRAERKNAELNLAIKRGEFVSVRDAGRAADRAVKATGRVIDKLPEEYVSRLMKAGVKSRAAAHRILHDAAAWLKDGVTTQFRLAGKSMKDDEK